MKVLDAWLKTIRQAWNLLFAAGTWIAAVVATVVLSPSDILGEGASAFSQLPSLAVFIVAVSVGIVFIFAIKLNGKPHAWLWLLVTIASLGFSVWAVLKYYDLTASLICVCNAKRAVKGDQYKSPRMMGIFYPDGFTCSNLCQKFVDERGKPLPEKIWTEESINKSQNELAHSYLLCFPFMALAIMSVGQTIYCSLKKDAGARRRTPSKEQTQDRRLSDRDGEILSAILENPPEPNETLRKAVKNYKKQINK